MKKCVKLIIYKNLIKNIWVNVTENYLNVWNEWLAIC